MAGDDGRPGVAARAAGRRAAVPQPQRRRHRVRARRLPVRRRWATAAAAATPRATGRTRRPCWARSCASTRPAPTGGEAYGIPADNPFADGAGGAPEVWLYGVRNPWRFTLRPPTPATCGSADVGQNACEEIDLLPAADGGGRGANLGWNEMEGTHPFEGGTQPRRRRAARCSSTTTTRAARSPAAWSTGARRSRACRAPTCSATTATATAGDPGRRRPGDRRDARSTPRATNLVSFGDRRGRRGVRAVARRRRSTGSTRR